MSENVKKNPLTLQDIKDAAARIKPYVTRTPLLREADMDELLGCKVYFKPEMLQVTGAFKARGAFNKVLMLSEEERKKGIIFSSSGNHAAACAYVGKMFGINAYAVMPRDTPKGKIENCERRGGTCILWDRDYQSRVKKVADEIKEHGYTLVHGFDDYSVMAGQGTIGLEILEDMPEINTVIVPIGGGGLMSGIATAIKESNPKVRVIGVQVAASCGYYLSRLNGRPTRMTSQPSLADGIGCSYPTENPYPIIDKYVDEIVIVSENHIAEAVKIIGKYAHLVAEPTSAVVVAALLEGKIKTEADENVACVLTSGNYDIDLIGKFYKDEEVEPED